MKLKFAILCFSFLCFLSRGDAQQQFSEGTIVYTVTIEKKGEDGAVQTATGEFLIMLKDKQFSKELNLSSGFKNLFIFNTEDHTVYSLRKVQDKKYAIQLNSEAFKKKQQRCASANIQDIGVETKTVAGYAGQHARAICTNADPVELYYTKEWFLVNTELFQNFAGFRYLPLIYDIKNEDGSILHFVLKRIESKPVDNGVFRIPKDYKIMSNEEYNAITR